MKSPLKIIIFDGSLRPSSFIFRLSKGLASSHRVYIMGFSGKPYRDSKQLRYIDLGSASNGFHLFIKSLVWSMKSLIYKGDFTTFFKTLKNVLFFNKKALQQQNFHTSLALLNPTIIHIQWPSLLPWCEKILEDQNYPVILSQRGFQLNVRPFVDEANRKYLQQWFPKITGFHSVSKAMEDTGNSIWNASEKINKVVYSGFDFEQLPFRQDYQKHSPLQLLSVGRPHWVKGYSVSLYACVALKKAGFSFQYQIIGAAMDEELLVLIDTFELSEHVVLLPKISQKEVYEYMNSSDLLLFPSHIEGLPNVVVEAMAIGLPVVATDCGGITELIDEATGIIVPTRDDEAMASAVLSFSKKSIQEINIMRFAAREKVLEQHNINRMVTDMEALYKKCLK